MAQDSLIAAASRVAKADRIGWERFLSEIQALTSGYYAKAILSDTAEPIELGRHQGYARLCTLLLEKFTEAGREPPPAKPKEGVITHG